MKIEELLRKLQPLRPRKVKHWRKSLDLADSDVRKLIEAEIIGIAYRVLGDFRTKLLLSLPAPEQSQGTTHLGTIQYEEPRHAFSLKDSELLQNMAIFGRSGAGKTNVAFHLLNQLAKHKIPFLFLDWKRTARHLLPALQGNLTLYTPGRSLKPFPFNPFIPPPGLEPKVYANHVVDVLGDAYTLGDAARSVLQKALVTTYEAGQLAPTPKDLINRVEAIPDKERVRGWKTSAVRALETVQTIELAKADVSQGVMVRTLLTSSTVIELDGMSPSNKKFLAPILCLWLYYLRLPFKTREKLGLVIFLEEAHHFLYQRKANQESLMEMLLRQCREIGIGIIVIDQHPHLISSAAIGNTYTNISLNLKEPKDINKASAISLVPEDDKRHITQLPVGYGIVKLQDRWRHPFLVRFPYVNVDKGVVTDEDLAANRVEYGTRSTRSVPKPTQNYKTDPEGSSRAEDPALTPWEICFVQDVLRYQDDGVDKRYKRLKLSADKGNTIKKTLVERGILEEQLIRIKRTRRMFLRITSLARRNLGLERTTQNIESLEHEYWKRWWARKYQSRGYRVKVEAARNVGRVDVLATRASESVAIEVETGMSDVVWNVKQDFLSGFHRVIVVATDDQALEKVGHRLAKAGLVINRVKIVLREDTQSAETNSIPAR